MSRRSERGQSIIILALSFVVMLGFAGIAIDGGILYADRRSAQSHQTQDQHENQRPP